jgi:hypothetical protein
VVPAAVAARYSKDLYEVRNLANFYILCGNGQLIPPAGRGVASKVSCVATIEYLEYVSMSEVQIGLREIPHNPVTFVEFTLLSWITLARRTVSEHLRSCKKEIEQLTPRA